MPLLRNARNKVSWSTSITTSRKPNGAAILETGILGSETGSLILRNGGRDGVLWRIMLVTSFPYLAYLITALLEQS
jgi:hypothetical protein